MAQRVLGIDLGAHSVKIAELDVGFRTAKLESLKTFRVIHHADPIDASLSSLPKDLGIEASDLVNVGVPSERVLLRNLEIPFVDPKKAHAVVSAALDEELPWDFEDIVFDHMPAITGSTLVAITKNEELSLFLKSLEDYDLVPRQLGAGPLVYGPLLQRFAGDNSVLLLDIGHIRTNLCLLHEGQTIYGRTILRAGAHLTEIIRRNFQFNEAEAEEFKHQRGVINTDEHIDAATRKITELMIEGLAPLVREIKRSIMTAEGKTGIKPSSILLTGGTSLLAGLDRYLSEQFALPVQRLDLSQDEQLGAESLTSEGLAVAAQSLSLCLEIGHRDVLNFRQGEFAFQTDKSFFREKLFALATAAMLILVFAGISAYASLTTLRKEEKVLEKSLRQESRLVLGKVMMDPNKVSRTLKKGAKSTSAEIPSITAVDIFKLISEKVPEKDKVVLDLSRVDIKAGKTYLSGTVDSLSSVGNIVKTLKGVECFKKVTQGRISDVSNGKKFTLTIISSCF